MSTVSRTPVHRDTFSHVGGHTVTGTLGGCILIGQSGLLRRISLFGDIPRTSVYGRNTGCLEKPGKQKQASQRWQPRKLPTEDA